MTPFQGGRSIRWASAESVEELDEDEEEKRFAIEICIRTDGMILVTLVWAILTNVDNASPLMEATLINDFVLCATRTANANGEPTRQTPLAITHEEIKTYLLEKTLGIDPDEIHPIGHAGTVAELRASKLWGKPFRVQTTSRPEEHLVIDEDAGCLYILDSLRSNVYILDTQRKLPDPAGLSI